MDKLKKEIYERVKVLRFRQMQGAGFIQKRLFKELNKDVPLTLIKEIIEEIKDAKDQIKTNNNIIEEAQLTLGDTKNMEKGDGGLKKLVASDKNAVPYEVTDDHYIFIKDNRRYPVLISTVRAIFESYSMYGKNMSGESVRQQFKITPLVWNLIKSYTQLYKTSHIDDPVTLSRLKPSEIDEYIEGKVPRVIDDKYIEKYKTAVDRKKEADLRKFALSNRGYDLFMEKLENVIKLYEPRDFDTIKTPEIPNSKTKEIFITDAHFGKQGTDGIYTRFKKLTRDLVECEEKNINITFGGDLGECFIPYGEMHPGQRIGMENINTEDLVMLIVDVFEQMLLALYKAGKKVIFNGMGGNHDRFTEKKEFDPYRTPAMVIYRFLQKIVENTNIKVNILRDKANVIKSGKTKYIFIHGDGLSLEQVKNRAMDETEDGFYLVIVSGDKHHLKVHELTKNVVRIQSPALAGQGKYDSELGLSSLPGALFFSKNKDGLMDITIKRYE